MESWRKEELRNVPSLSPVFCVIVLFYPSMMCHRVLLAVTVTATVHVTARRDFVLLALTKSLSASAFVLRCWRGWKQMTDAAITLLRWLSFYCLSLRRIFWRRLTFGKSSSQIALGETVTIRNNNILLLPVVFFVFFIIIVSVWDASFWRDQLQRCLLWLQLNGTWCNLLLAPTAAKTNQIRTDSLLEIRIQLLKVIRRNSFIGNLFAC